MENISDYYKNHKLERSWLGLASGLDLLVALIYELEQLGNYNKSLSKQLISDKICLEKFYNSLSIVKDSNILKLLSKGPTKFVSPPNMGKSPLGSTKLEPLAEVFLNRLLWLIEKLFGQSTDPSKWDCSNLVYSIDISKKELLKQFALNIAKYTVLFNGLDERIKDSTTKRYYKLINLTLDKDQDQVQNKNLDQEPIQNKNVDQEPNKNVEHKPKLILTKTINWLEQPLYVKPPPGLEHMAYTNNRYDLDTLDISLEEDLPENLNEVTKETQSRAYNRWKKLEFTNQVPINSKQEEDKDKEQDKEDLNNNWSLVRVKSKRK